MTTYEKCCAIRHILLTRAAEVVTYPSWSDEFCVKHLRELAADLIERHPELELDKIQPCELTSTECDELRFGTWSAENPMRMIPLWLYPFLADDVRVACIDGSAMMCKQTMDNDHRGGWLAYGILPVNRVSEYGKRAVRVDD